MNYDAYDLIYAYLDPEVNDDNDLLYCRDKIKALGDMEALHLFDRCTSFRYCPDSELPF